MSVSYYTKFYIFPSVVGTELTHNIQWTHKQNKLWYCQTPTAPLDSRSNMSSVSSIRDAYQEVLFIVIFIVVIIIFYDIISTIVIIITIIIIAISVHL